MREPSESDAPELDPLWRKSLRRRVLAWYARHGRSLPWRDTRDPYRVWVSEVMLQQTTVAAVIPYYERFLARFPDVVTLASAPEHDVMRLWEGLGYYSRARNLHVAAKRIAADQGGAFPKTAAEFSSLRGIGRYTAGAIVSFAFDEPAPIVEANTLRLYSRLIGFEGDPRSTAGQRRLWSFAEAIVPRRNAGRFNHALMDLGATVCTVQKPRCEVCPVRSNCVAFRSGRQNVIPRLKQRRPLTDVTEAYVTVRHGDRYLLRRRSEGERWAGLWDFPRLELPPGLAAQCRSIRRASNGQKRLPLESDESPPRAIREYLEQHVPKTTGVGITVGEPFAEIRHGVTRFRIRVFCFHASRRSGAIRDSDSLRWASPAELPALALSRPARRLAGLLK